MTQPISNQKDLKAALQLAIGLELSTIPVYLTALYSIKDGCNTDAAQTIRSVVMEEMLHMTLAANVLNALGQVPSPDPVEFQGRRNLSPIPDYPLNSPLISGIGTLELLPFCPEAVAGFVEIEHPLHGAANLADIDIAGCSYRTIGEFYEAILTALNDKKICKDSDFAKNSAQIPDSEYYGGAGHVVEVTDRASARRAIQKIVDEGEGLPEKCLRQEAKKVTDEDRLHSGWQMYSHYARFRELQTGRRFRTHQLANQVPEGALLLVDYSAVHPALYTRRNGTTGGPEAVALNQFDLTYSRLVDDLYLAFAGVEKVYDNSVRVPATALQSAVHGMYALKNRAVALMRTPDPAHPGHTLCPRFSYVPPGGERDKLSALTQELREQQG
ncbi:ferritin-like protein [Streptomyces sp. NPDC050625]|uniref:ferritin-like domain-containing protein n=1 Tax=Streptomyces sp. NPDC050625 TaxID=3154629 RepID=UPI00342E48EB